MLAADRKLFEGILVNSVAWPVYTEFCALLIEVNCLSKDVSKFSEDSGVKMFTELLLVS